MKNNQIGLRKDFTTEDHLLTIKSLMEKNLAENKKLYFCFADFRMGYYSIWREALFKKLGYEVSRTFVSYLKKMYKKPS